MVKREWLRKQDAALFVGSLFVNFLIFFEEGAEERPGPRKEHISQNSVGAPHSQCSHSWAACTII